MLPWSYPATTEQQQRYARISLSTHSKIFIRIREEFNCTEVIINKEWRKLNSEQQHAVTGFAIYVSTIRRGQIATTT